MFKNLRNNYYFGKAGKADLRPEDLPRTRMQLFSVTLRTRLPSMIRVNILYLMCWIPTIVILFMAFSGVIGILNETPLEPTAEEALKARNTLHALAGSTLLWLFPCIAITGPFTAGISKIMRNWARDEHAFVWSDFKDAVKENWKQGLLVSFLTGLMPLIVFYGYTFYGDQAQANMLFLVPQAMVVIVGMLWSISVTYMYPLMVCYQAKAKDMLKNAFLLGIARLPQSVGIRLLHCVPVALFLLIGMLIPGPASLYVVMVLFLYYSMLGLCLSRFITAAYTNAVFDRFINSRMEGVPVNRGMLKPEDDLDADQDEQDEQNGNAPEA